MEQQLNKAIANERYACEMKLDEEIRKVSLQFETEKEVRSMNFMFLKFKQRVFLWFL